MDFQLHGKRALVTGSNTGIGAEIARMLASEGASVVVHGRNEARARDVADEIAKDGGAVAVAVGDLANPADADKVIKAGKEAFGGIDILVNNAGGSVNPANQTWFSSPIEEWTANFHRNAVPYVRMIQAFAPAMIERKWGRIIQISSRTATAPHPPVASYAASKAAITNMTVSLARALAGTGVTANTVSPGLIWTSQMEAYLAGIAARMGWGNDIEKARDHTLKNMLNQSVERFGQPKDVAWAVTWLASPLSDFVSGTNLHIDGGSLPTVN